MVMSGVQPLEDAGGQACFYGDPYGFGGGYGPPSYYPAYPAQYYTSGNTVYHHRRKPPKEKDNAQVWCDVCDVGCIGQQSYIEHCGGRKHQLLERKKAQQSSASPQEGQQRPTEAEITGTQTTSSSVRFNPYDASSQGSSKGSQGKFYCELCKIYSNDQSTFQLHLAGKKHKTTLQRLQPVATDPYGPAVTPISPMSIIHPPRYHIPSSPRSHFTPTLTNTPTNVEDDLLLNSKLESLTPSTSDTLSLRHLVETVAAKLDEYSEKSTQSQSTAAASPPVVVETKLVGPYAWGTLLKVNLVADIVVITKEHPTFGTMRFMQQALTEAIPDAHFEIGKDTMDMHIRMLQGYGVHLLFTWIGAWDADERDEPFTHDVDYQKNQNYNVYPPTPPLSSPTASPSPPPSPFPSHSYTTHPTPPESAAKPSGGSWVVKTWVNTSTSRTTSPSTSTITSTTTTSTSQPNVDGPIPSTSTPNVPFNDYDVTLSRADVPAHHAAAPTAGPPSTTDNIPSSHVPISTTSTTTSTTAQITSNQDPLSQPLTSSLQDINLLATQRALLMIRQAMWFSHNSLSPNVRQCIKIMKDLRHRHTAFAPVNNWALEVMVVNALRTLPLSASISQSLRAIFAFVASGTLLPGVDLLDPCVQYGSVLQDLTQEERLAITKAAQKILNDIAFGRWEVIVG